MSKVGVGLLLTVALVLTPLWASAAEFKVGVVDGMDVVSKSAAGKGVQDSIKRKSEELGKPFAQRRQELAKQVEDFQKQASVMKEDARKTKAEELEKKMQEFQKSGRRRRKTTAAISGTATGPIIPETGRRRQSRGPGGEAGYRPGQAQCRAPLHGPQAGHHR